MVNRSRLEAELAYTKRQLAIRDAEIETLTRALIQEESEVPPGVDWENELILLKRDILESARVQCEAFMARVMDAGNE